MGRLASSRRIYLSKAAQSCYRSGKKPTKKTHIASAVLGRQGQTWGGQVSDRQQGRGAGVRPPTGQAAQEIEPNGKAATEIEQLHDFITAHLQLCKVTA